MEDVTYHPGFRLDEESIAQFVAGGEVIDTLTTAGILPLFVLGDSDYSIDLAEEFYQNMAPEDDTQVVGLTGKIRDIDVRLSARIIGTFLNLSTEGAIAITKENFKDAWAIMRGEGTPVEPISKMNRNKFSLDVYLLDKSLEFKNGSHDMFVTKQLHHTMAIVLNLQMNWSQIILNYLHEAVLEVQTNAAAPRPFVRLINVLLRRIKGMENKIS